mmetsp:Transcript_26097/g.42643  ORF Transcript_26097/g.42643 Transcript_26097/m.42643 type:complete len:169 (+) Transcript_26097:31-537(+)
MAKNKNNARLLTAKDIVEVLDCKVENKEIVFKVKLKSSDDLVVWYKEKEFNSATLTKYKKFQKFCNGESYHEWRKKKIKNYLKRKQYRLVSSDDESDDDEIGDAIMAAEKQTLIEAVAVLQDIGFENEKDMKDIQNALDAMYANQYALEALPPANEIVDAVYDLLDVE